MLKFITAAALTLLSSAALAQTYVERPYDPPVGSKWQIVTETTTVEDRPGSGNRDHRVQMRADVTIDEKLPNGFRVTYTNRGIEVTGNAPTTKLVGDAYAAMKDIPVRARLDSAGRPVEVENLAEVKATMRGVIDKVSRKFDGNPKLADFLRQMLRGLLDAEGRDAAAVYLEELPQLAAVQNIGLQPGKARTDTESTPSPFGTTRFKTVLTTRLDTYDEKTKSARFVRKREFEKEALRQVVLDMVHKLAAVDDKKAITPEVLEMVKKVSFSMEGETIYFVDNGMTVWIDDREFTRASVMGTTFTKQQKRTIAVTRQN